MNPDPEPGRNASAPTFAFALALLGVVGAAAPARAGLVINEVVTSNITGLPDAYEADLQNCPVADCARWYRDLGESPMDGDYPDWIEVHNDGAEPVDLAGFGLSDDVGDRMRWTFPEGATVPAGGYFIVFASGRPEKEDAHPHADFKLSRTGEPLFLSDAGGTLLDAVDTGAIPPDFSAGRTAGGGWAVFAEPTPGGANSGEPFSGFTATVVPSVPAGLHESPFALTLAAEPADAGHEVRYTTDGSVPTVGSALADGPFAVTETQAIRARVFNGGQFVSEVLTFPCFIGTEHPFPVVSLVTEPANFFDTDTGIYVPGRNAREDDRVANYWNDWERPVRVDFFEPDGTHGFGVDAGVKVFGWGSRRNPQKSLAVQVRDRYGAPEIEYDLFPGHPVTRFTSFVLRAGGSDATSTGTFLRDPFASGLVRDRDLDVQAFRPTVVYINGEYFGIQNLREKLNEDFLASHHGVDRDDVDMVSRYWRRTYPVVIEGDDTAYRDLEEILGSQDLTLPGAFDIIASLVDVDNIIDYFATQIYYANYDWPGNNSKCWRPREPDSRWRWLTYDLDYTFGSNGSQNDARHNTLRHALTPTGGWPNPSYTLIVFRSLLDNPEFAGRFANRIADLMNTAFVPETALAWLDELESTYEPEMERHTARWARRGDAIRSVASWKRNLDVIRSFVQTRRTFLFTHVRQHFRFPGTGELALAVDPPGSARVWVNSVEVAGFPWSGEYFESLPVQLAVAPGPGFRFAGWEGAPDGVDPADPRPVVDVSGFADGAPPMTARFEPDPGAVNAVVVSEIRFAPGGTANSGDWVELHNASGVPADLGGYVLRDETWEHRYTIPDGTVVPAGGFLVVAQNPAQFEAAHPGAGPVVGGFPFGLDNKADSVRLFDRRQNPVDAVTYSDADPWPNPVDGTGSSLALVAPSLDNTAGENWRASAEDGGTPGAPNGLEPPVATPTITAVRRTSTGGFEIDLTLPPGASYQIDRSPDLESWIPWQTIDGTDVTSTVTVEDPDPAMVRFYRAGAAAPGPE